MSDEQQLPVPSEKVSTPVPRLSSPSQIQTHGLTAERAAKIVNQSGSSRMAALLGIAVVTLDQLGRIAPGARLSDGPHFSAEGHAAFAAYLAPQVRAAGACGG
jgi:acyl-CoA thioesterase-1